MTPKQERVYQAFLRKRSSLTPKEQEFFDSLQAMKDEENAWKGEVIEKIEKICNGVISNAHFSLLDNGGYEVFIQDEFIQLRDRILAVLKNEEEE
jgi:hypothetical protein